MQRQSFVIPLLILCFLLAIPVLAQTNEEVYLPIVVRPGLTPTATQAPQPTQIPPTDDPKALVNHYRSLAGVPPVTFNTVLDDNCWQHARYMAENQDLTHDQNPALPYASPAGQLCAQKGNAWLGWASIPNYWQPRHSIEGWMSSTGHRLWLIYPTTPTFGYGFYSASNNYSGAALDVLSTANFSADAAFTGWPLRYPAPNQVNIPAGDFPITLNWRYFGSAPTITNVTLQTGSGQNVPSTYTTSLAASHKGVEVRATGGLQSDTTYSIAITGSYDGSPFDYVWQFTTAP